ncbi:MAG: transcription-repair coupling factor [Oscillospiraceae bacterium]|nr:transcription-repair coupling factor [Oscillospiraceae bacterium]
MKLFSAVAHNLESYGRMLEDLKKGNTPALCTGLGAIHKANFITAAAEDLAQPIVVLCEDDIAAARLASDLNAMAGEERALIYPSRDLAYRQMETISSEYEQARLGVLSRILTGDAPIVVASVQAAMGRTIPPDRLRESTFTVTVEQAVPMEELVARLAAAGYIRRPQVDGVGQYAVRGGIVDVFLPREQSPIRVEYWGDEIDTLSYFELDSQRRTDPADRLSVSPASEVVANDETLKEPLAALIQSLGSRKSTAAAKEVLQKDLDTLESGMELDSYDKYFPLVYDRFCCLLDYYDNAPVFYSEQSAGKENARAVFWQYSEDIKLLFSEGQLCKGLDSYMLSPEELEARLEGHRAVYLETFARTTVGRIKDLITVSPLQNSGWNGDLKLLKSDLDPLLEQGYCCVVMSGTPKSAETLAEDLKSIGLPAQYERDLKAIRYRKVFVLAGNLSSGFEYPEIKFSLTTTSRSYNLPAKKPKKRKGEEIRSLSDLTQGDYVVHVTHGIGVFDGIHKLDVHGVVKDYIKIKYAGSDILYVPVTQLDLVSKYIGPREDSKVKLNRLHSGEWQKTRQRVRKAVDEMADELIALYAKRMSAKGYAFSEDTEFQRDFEAHFEYQETDDQLRCIQEIKADMERPVPMERLLCGDVGFGKTEVALRAAFKCVTEGKQCAILCPTTILAWQHFQTLRQRMGNFPVRVELLSRFRSPKEQKQIVRELEKGLVDIVVGTHRLVSKDIHFKDLGLAIIDEEQRFGVAHKERFKEMLASVDMLTLSATPIPRTLNMAMSGIRDMSVIEEAPQNRHPIQTYVLEYDEGIVMEALRKELRRGGQAYYIHNNIETIHGVAARIKEAIPEARIAVAHGKMPEEELSQVWKQLMEQEIDILVCTTIIETGVDVSNCNTLVIENADRMGLSQLYQLRGRVGRSNRRAYAYFTFQRGKVLTEVAAKRLSAIREFTKFGSGFRIALRDLEIRGAGNILGTRQHGHMEAVGYDMYLRLLSEAVAEKRGEAPAVQATAECLVDVQLEAHIPEKYIENLSQRIDVYRKIASIKTEEDSLDVLDELIDRFGEPPASVKGLIDVALLRNTAAQFGFKEITQKGDSLHLIPEKLDPNLVAMLNTVLKGRCTAVASGTPCVVVKMKNSDALTCMREIMNTLQGFQSGESIEKLRSGRN